MALFKKGQNHSVGLRPKPNFPKRQHPTPKTKTTLPMETANGGGLVRSTPHKTPLKKGTSSLRSEVKKPFFPYFCLTFNIVSKIQVNINWSDGHTSTFDVEWLKNRTFSQEKRETCKELVHGPAKVPWRSDKMKSLRSRSYNFDDVTQNGTYQLQWLEGKNE